MKFLPIVVILLLNMVHLSVAQNVEQKLQGIVINKTDMVDLTVLEILDEFNLRISEADQKTMKITADKALGEKKVAELKVKDTSLFTNIELVSKILDCSVEYGEDEVKFIVKQEKPVPKVANTKEVPLTQMHAKWLVPLVDVKDLEVGEMIDEIRLSSMERHNPKLVNFVFIDQEVMERKIDRLVIRNCTTYKLVNIIAELTDLDITWGDVVVEIRSKAVN